MPPRVIISTVGTSLLTNPATKDEVSILYEHSNCKENECPEAIRSLIENCYTRALDNIFQTDIEKIKQVSAEINGICGIYADSFPKDSKDIHFLVSTDTFQGLRSAELVKEFLAFHKLTASIYTPSNLTTKDKNSFSDGIKEILKWCQETMPGYKKNGYEIVFNLTGGFKSLQGYMNTIGMFYADKIVYIFESKTVELIEIPRLPIQIDQTPFECNKEKLLLLNANRICKKEEFINVPEAILDEVNGNVLFSVWGELMWNNIKDELFNKLPSLPYLAYKKSFETDFKGIKNSDERMKLIETLAKISVHLEKGNGDTTRLRADGGLQYEDYTNLNGIAHFRITQGIRVSCQSRGNILLLRRYGKEPDVNKNP